MTKRENFKAIFALAIILFGQTFVGMGHDVEVPLFFEIHPELDKLDQNDEKLIDYVKEQLLEPPPIIRNDITEVRYILIFFRVIEL